MTWVTSCSSPLRRANPPPAPDESQRFDARASGDGSVAAQPAQPLHETLIELLKTSDSVVPPPLPVHPLLAVYNGEAVVPPMCYTRTEGRHK